MKKLNVQKLTLCGVMAALVFVMTYFPKIPVPVTGGYVHLGDGAIFLSVLLLGPLGIPAAAVGSMLSDLIGGYMVYVLPTFLIKGLVALVAWKLCRKDQPLLALLSFLLAEAVMVLGYFLLEWALYGVASAAAAIGPNVVQGHRGRADWDAVPADYAPAGARGEAVTNRDANGFPLWKTLASFFNDAEKSPDGGQIRREMCYNSILEGDTLSPEAEARCKETLREIVR